MQRYNLVYLSSPPQQLLSGNVLLNASQRETVQAPNLWSIFFYEHGNAVTVGSTTFKVDEGDIIVFAPGVRVAHARIGEGARYDFISFDMPGKDGLRGAMPTHVPQAQYVRKDWVAGGLRIIESVTPLRAFVWNFMCGHSANLSEFRSNFMLYEAEAWIMRELENRFTVQDLARALGTSPRHLVRAFRQDHGVSVNEYIQQKRVQEAARLLLNTELSVKQIAAKVGFEDLQHFNKVMRSRTGASPRGFRELSGTKI